MVDDQNGESSTVLNTEPALTGEQLAAARKAAAEAERKNEQRVRGANSAAVHELNSRLAAIEATLQMGTSQSTGAPQSQAVPPVTVDYEKIASMTRQAANEALEAYRRDLAPVAEQVRTDAMSRAKAAVATKYGDKLIAELLDDSSPEKFLASAEKSHATWTKYFGATATATNAQQDGGSQSNDRPAFPETPALASPTPSSIGTPSGKLPVAGGRTIEQVVADKLQGMTQSERVKYIMNDPDARKVFGGA